MYLRMFGELHVFKALISLGIKYRNYGTSFYLLFGMTLLFI
jgi:hypothetical protein